ncbi:hypothetical protein ACFZDI_18730 [Streptomyces sp. NPDC007907]|uniref:hypothetical protein n=1 Tax=Streptomyces sp. NPDC007907 TaxID=3364789 RepID=UPI0036E62F98
MATPDYKLAHTRVRSRYGPAKNWFCAFCGLSADHWAIDHDSPDLQRDEKGRAYSLDPDHYVSLCRRCHGAYDKHVAQHGTTGLLQLLERLWDSASDEQRDASRKGILSSIGCLLRIGYLRPGRDRAYRQR